MEGTTCVVLGRDQLRRAGLRIVQVHGLGGGAVDPLQSSLYAVAHSELYLYVALECAKNCFKADSMLGNECNSWVGRVTL